MTEPIDRVVWHVFATSATARAIERGGRLLRTAAMHSRVTAAARSWVAASLARAGTVMLVAALTHMVLMAAIVRPPYWQWLILPSIALAAGAVLMSRKNA